MSIINIEWWYVIHADKSVFKMKEIIVWLSEEEIVDSWCIMGNGAPYAHHVFLDVLWYFVIDNV